MTTEEYEKEWEEILKDTPIEFHQFVRKFSNENQFTCIGIMLEEKLIQMFPHFNTMSVERNENGNLQIRIWKKIHAPRSRPYSAKLEEIKQLLKAKGVKCNEITNRYEAGHLFELYETDPDIENQLNQLIGKEIFPN